MGWDFQDVWHSKISKEYIYSSLLKEKGGKFMDSNYFIRNIKWNDGTIICNTSNKNIYDMFKKDQSML